MKTETFSYLKGQKVQHYIRFKTKLIQTGSCQKPPLATYDTRIATDT